MQELTPSQAQWETMGSGDTQMEPRLPALTQACSSEVSILLSGSLSWEHIQRECLRYMRAFQQ